MDSLSRRFWRGMSDDEYDRIVDLLPEQTSLTVGTATALLVGPDGVVRDDSWMEVFQAEDETLAIVQVSGPDYRTALDAALAYPYASDDRSSVLTVPSGELAIFSAALDGVGEQAMPLLAPAPGPAPVQHGSPSREIDTGLRVPTRHRAWTCRVRWYTEVDDENCFARWLLEPLPDLWHGDL